MGWLAWRGGEWLGGGSGAACLGSGRLAWSGGGGEWLEEEGGEGEGQGQKICVLWTVCNRYNPTCMLYT